MAISIESLVLVVIEEEGMIKRIEDTGPHLDRIVDKGTKLGKINPDQIKKGLEANVAVTELSYNADPINLLALRDRLLTELVSTGGRPSRGSARTRRKISITDGEWAKLVRLSQLMNRLGVKAAPGQVAGALLGYELEQLQLDFGLKAICESDKEDQLLNEEVNYLLCVAAEGDAQSLQPLEPIAKELLRRMKVNRKREAEDARKPKKQ